MGPERPQVELQEPPEQAVRQELPVRQEGLVGPQARLEVPEEPQGEQRAVPEPLVVRARQVGPEEQRARQAGRALPERPEEPD